MRRGRGHPRHTASGCRGCRLRDVMDNPGGAPSDLPPEPKGCGVNHDRRARVMRACWLALAMGLRGDGAPIAMSDASQGLSPWARCNCSALRATPRPRSRDCQSPDGLTPMLVAGGALARCWGYINPGRSVDAVFPPLAQGTFFLHLC